MTETRAADVVVVGGGLAGLVAAATAARAGAAVTLLERADGAGRASTDERGGFLLNRGAHALYRGGEAEAVLDRLGVIPTGGVPPTKGSLALVGGELSLLPVGGASLMRTGMLGVRDKAKLGALLARLLKMDARKLSGRSVEWWIGDAGLDGIAADVMRALVRLTTYVVATDLLAADAAVAQMQAAFTRGVRYLDGGWGRMAASILEKAKSAGVVVERAVVSAIEAGGDGVDVRLGDGGVLAVPAAIVAAGPPAVSGALLAGGAPPSWTALGPEVVASCLDLGLVRQPEHRFIIGIDRPLYFSVHHPPAELAPGGGVVAHAMTYVHPGSSDDAATTRAAMAVLAAKAGVVEGDIAVQRYLHRMVVAGAAPMATSGGLGGRPGTEVEGHPGVFVAGDWVGSTGLLADAALASAEAAGAAAARHASRAIAHTA